MNQAPDPHQKKLWNVLKFATLFADSLVCSTRAVLTTTQS
jgi:hypothetical protein